jgi:hypothetical protein
MRATASFEAALESALQDLARTGDVETCLRRYPGHAEQLRPLLETAATVRGHYHVVPPPAPAGLTAGRERFLAVAAQERMRGASQASETGTTIRTLRGRLRPAFVSRLLPILLVALLGAVIFGGGVVWAASGSLPGELLYPVKLATEDVRLALASAPQGQVDLVLDLVKERADEIQALAQAGGPVPDGTVARLEQHIDRALVQTASASDEALPGLLMQVAERTGAQAQRLQQLQARAGEPFQAGLQRAVAACSRGAQAAEAGLNDPQAFRWRHQHRQGEPESTQEPQQEQHQEQNREQEGQPTHAPRVTPHGPQGSPRPEVTPRRVRVTATPGLTPTLTLSSTPQGPRSSASPQPTPQGPRSTASPQPTPQGPRSTSGPQPTPQGPGSTDGLQPTSQGPQSTAGPQPTSQGPQSTAGPQPTPQGPQATAVPPIQDPPATSQPGSGPGGSP